MGSPTPLGLFGILAPELRLKIYDHIFEPIYDAGAMVDNKFRTNVDGLQLLYLSKAIAAEAADFLKSHRRLRFTFELGHIDKAPRPILRQFIDPDLLCDVMNVDIHLQAPSFSWPIALPPKLTPYLNLALCGGNNGKQRKTCVFLFEGNHVGVTDRRTRGEYTGNLWNELAVLTLFDKLSVRCLFTQRSLAPDLEAVEYCQKKACKKARLVMIEELEALFGSAKVTVDRFDAKLGVLASWALDFRPSANRRIERATTTMSQLRTCSLYTGIILC